MSELSPQAVRAEALEGLLIERGLLDEAEIAVLLVRRPLVSGVGSLRAMSA